MLKNNEERLNYICDKRNWIAISDTGEHKPLIIIRKLLKTQFIDVKIWTDKLWYGDTPHYTSLGYFKLSNTNTVDTSIPYSKNDIIKWLRENKI